MCGLIGLASTEKLNGAHIRKAILQEGLLINSLRGHHSTGIAAFHIGEEEKDPYIYKRAVNGSDFVEMPGFDKVHRDIEKFSVVIGHNRFSTVGTINNQNAHPFQFGHITLAHNGHINNSDMILPTGKHSPIQVDSAKFALAMSLIGEQEALERAQGAFALTWFNSKDKTLNFARNSQRPLKFCYMKKENTMYWASERTLLVHLLGREDRYKRAEIDGKFKSVKEGVWIKFKLDDLRDFTTLGFQHRPVQVPAGRSQVITPAHSPTSSVVAPTLSPQKLEPAGQQPSEKTGTVVSFSQGDRFTRANRSLLPADWLTGRSVTQFQSTAISDILTTLKFDKTAAIQRDSAFQKNSGRPTKKKHIDKLRPVLKRMGFSYDQPVVFDPVKFEGYKNQQNMGKVLGYLKQTDIPADIANVSLGEFNSLRRQDVVLCRVVNFSPAEGTRRSPILILELDGRYPEFSEEWVKRKTQRILSRSGAGSVRDSSAGELVFNGPFSRSVSKDRYGELTKHGCAYCTGDLPFTVEGSKEVTWVDDAPYCMTCATDPTTQKELASGHVFPIPRPSTSLIH